MERVSGALASSRLLALAAVIVVVAALYFARDLLIPVSLAALLAFVLTPLAAWLTRGIGRVAAVVSVVVMACGLLLAVGYLVAVQVGDIATRLPAYRVNIEAKLQSLRGGVLQLAQAALHELDDRLRAPDTAPAGPVGPPAAPPPTVQMIAPPTSALMGIVSTFVPLLGPLGTGAVVILLMAFLLLERQSLKDRLISLLGRDSAGVSTQVLEDARRHLGRYLLMQAVVNGTHGVCVGVGLWAFGVPNFVLWGMLSTLLRFVPYVGPLVAAAMPITLALAVFAGWTQPLLVIGFFVLLEVVSNNVLEPWLYASSAGMSPLAVVVTATFWTWLWGPPGLVLATPLTICLVVLSRHVPRLGFLTVLLSDLPRLDADLRFHQRLLDVDQEGALAVAAQQLASGETLVQVLDGTIVPALAMYEVERLEGRLDARREEFVGRAVREIAEELHDASGPAMAVASDAPVVLCVPARSEGDEIVAELLGHVLGDAGMRTTTLSRAVLASELVLAVEAAHADIVCITALPPLGLAQARYLCKRLRARLPGLRILVGWWHAHGNREQAEARLGAGVDLRVATTFAEVLEQIAHWPTSTVPEPSPRPALVA